MTESLPNLRCEDIDQLGKALLTLAKELWVLKDRQAILEAALQEAGITSSELLDRYNPDEALLEKLAQERAAMIGELLSALEK